MFRLQFVVGWSILYTNLFCIFVVCHRDTLKTHISLLICVYIYCFCARSISTVNMFILTVYALYIFTYESLFYMLL